ncbi:Myc-type, basic helix-loop-helix (bHLH) domain-containing protein [Artemisia annua]|uniref:Myc-type, basic helix-loop-helix (BHLH) domain-containing protein n=1 Tax=Artemisia annua TaxID=35608 RepID=A0A2U1LEM5_ARTAN|nr:Myc-type, basic helix-loop-helix (bHLH) domain-containing protein [Artemisia annua]
MSSNRSGGIRRRTTESSSGSGGTPRMTDKQINELISKLQQLLPDTHRRSNNASTSKILADTCKCVRDLCKDVDNLSERLAQMLSSMDEDSPQARIIRDLIN